MATADFRPTPYVQTTDVASNAISVNSAFINVSGLVTNNETEQNSGITVANVNIVTQGGVVIILGNFRATDFIVSSNAQATVSLYRADSTTVQLNNQFAQIRLGSSTPIAAAQLVLPIFRIDAPPSGVNCYFVRAVSFPGSALIDQRQLSAVEIRR